MSRARFALGLAAFLAALPCGADQRTARSAPAVPTATPTPPPKTAVPFTHVQPIIVWVPDATYTMDPELWRIALVPKTDVRWTCTGSGLPPAESLNGNLRAAYTAEKGYMQERGGYGSPVEIGFSPEASVLRYCWKYTFTLVHDQAHPGNRAFFVAATAFRAQDGTPRVGPSACIASIAGALPAGQPGIDESGGPISAIARCVSLPVMGPPPSSVRIAPGEMRR